jgi:hypothetical protein
VRSDRKLVKIEQWKAVQCLLSYRYCYSDQIKGGWDGRVMRRTSGYEKCACLIWKVWREDSGVHGRIILEWIWRKNWMWARFMWDVRRVMNLWSYKSQGICWLPERLTVSFSRRILVHGVRYRNEVLGLLKICKWGLTTCMIFFSVSLCCVWEKLVWIFPSDFTFFLKTILYVHETVFYFLCLTTWNIFIKN